MENEIDWGVENGEWGTTGGKERWKANGHLAGSDRGGFKICKHYDRYVGEKKSRGFGKKEVG